MPIRIIVNGARGRMGTLSADAVAAEPDLEVIGHADRGDDLASLLREFSPDVLLDFTTPEAVFPAATMALDQGIRTVIGTSGLTEENIEVLARRCEALRLGSVIAPNFSLGAVLLMKLAADAVRVFPAVEIIELHHDGKRDAPSFTAIRTARLLREARQEPAEGDVPQGSETGGSTGATDRGTRGGLIHGVPIHSVRLPGLLAHQEVILGGTGQSLRLRHDTLDRTAFVPGILLAIRRCMDLDRLVVGLENLL